MAEKLDHIAQALILTAQARRSQELGPGTLSEVEVLRQ